VPWFHSPILTVSGPRHRRRLPAMIKNMTRLLNLFAALALVCALTACGAKAQSKRYPMEGTIKSVDAAAKSAVIDHKDIGDWMGAMTMEYPIKPDSELSKIKAGDHIQATVVVQDKNYYVTDIKVVPEPKK
jgi:Cu/Ag efflux protein CusF